MSLWHGGSFVFSKLQGILLFFNCLDFSLFIAVQKVFMKKQHYSDPNIPLTCESLLALVLAGGRREISTGKGHATSERKIERKKETKRKKELWVGILALLITN